MTVMSAELAMHRYDGPRKTVARYLSQNHPKLNTTGEQRGEVGKAATELVVAYDLPLMARTTVEAGLPV